MRFDIDSYREILDTITRNKARSFLTGFGVFWGIFMLVALIGGGQGMKEQLNNNFAGFATNSGIIFPQATTKAYHGFRKGRTWNLTYQDITRLKQHIPELDIVSPMLSLWGKTATFRDKTATCSFKGLLPNYTKIEEPVMYYGRYINDMDITRTHFLCSIL